MSLWNYIFDEFTRPRVSVPDSLRVCNWSNKKADFECKMYQCCSPDQFLTSHTKTLPLSCFQTFSFVYFPPPLFLPACIHSLRSLRQVKQQLITLPLHRRFVDRLPVLLMSAQTDRADRHVEFNAVRGNRGAPVPPSDQNRDYR